MFARATQGRRMIGRAVLLAAMLLLTTGCGTLQNRWEETRAEDTIAAYEAFLREHPEAKQAAQARENLAGLHTRRDWEEAARLDAPPAYRNFLAIHPEGQEAEKARARLRALAPPLEESFSGEERYSGAFLKRHGKDLFRAGHSSGDEDPAFAESVRQGTIAAYEAFLRRYPAGGRADEAQKRLEALFFEEAQTEGTVAACERYLQRYPQGRFADLVRSQREKLTRRVIMTPRRFANIRAARRANAALRGRLQAGDLVRADLLRDGWYAVFALTEQGEGEERALGYVHASLLVPAPAAPKADRGEKPIQAPPALESAPAPPPVTVREILFQAVDEGRERLRIAFDRHHLPVLSSLAGKVPRILIELRHARPLSPQWANLEPRGRLIRSIYGRTDLAAQSVQIVLEMDPRRNYAVHPVYYERDNVYVLEISEVK